jgi:hypothetical protein
MSGGIGRRKLPSCPSGCVQFAYDLPIRLDGSILPFLEPLGKLAYPFEKTGLLRLECPGFTVNGIKRLREVRVSLKKGMTERDILAFEQALGSWLAKIGG